MRPVERGKAPKEFKVYGDAAYDLEDRMGNYCSYCEREFADGLEVEHVSPKSRDPERETDWENFLIACKMCNTIKGAKVTNHEDFLWPDKDNTHIALRYGRGGIVNPDPEMPTEVVEQAQRLIDLIGLDRHPGQPPAKQPTKKDRRYRQREQLWKLAIKAKDSLVKDDTEQARWLVSELARSKGFFSIWMSVFEEDLDMRKRFVNAFTGTATNCFDEHFRPTKRPGGRV